MRDPTNPFMCVPAFMGTLTEANVEYIIGDKKRRKHIGDAVARQNSSIGRCLARPEERLLQKNDINRGLLVTVPWVGIHSPAYYCIVVVHRQVICAPVHYGFGHHNKSDDKLRNNIPLRDQKSQNFFANPHHPEPVVVEALAGRMIGEYDTIDMGHVKFLSCDSGLSYAGNCAPTDIVAQAHRRKEQQGRAIMRENER